MNQRAQVLTLDVLHGDELHAIPFTEVVNANDVAMGDPLGQPQFLLEAVNDRGILRQVGTNHLQRDHAIEFQIARLVDRAHAALPQRLQDLVPPRQDRSMFQFRLRRADSPSRRTTARGGRNSIRQSGTV